MRKEIAVVTATLVAVPVFGTLTAVPAGADTNDTADAAAFVAAINQLRGSQHLAPLTVNQQLVSTALGWSQTMANSGSIFHNPSLAASMPAGWQAGGENVGMGATETLIENAFVNSPEHYANMVDPVYNQIGVGVLMTSSGMLYVTEDFLEAPVVAPAIATSVPGTSKVPAAAVPAAATPAPPRSVTPPSTVPAPSSPAGGPATTPTTAAVAIPSPAASAQADAAPIASPEVPPSLPVSTESPAPDGHVTVAEARMAAARLLPRGAIPAGLAGIGVGFDGLAVALAATVLVPLLGRRRRSTGPARG